VSTGVEPSEPGQHSSVKLSVNAKGHRQWEIRCVADDNTPEAMRRAAETAAQIDAGFEQTYGVPG
jgi:hypothetical protein